MKDENDFNRAITFSPCELATKEKLAIFNKLYSSFLAEWSPAAAATAATKEFLRFPGN